MKYFSISLPFHLSFSVMTDFKKNVNSMPKYILHIWKVVSVFYGNYGLIKECWGQLKSVVVITEEANVYETDVTPTLANKSWIFEDESTLVMVTGSGSGDWK